MLGLGFGEWVDQPDPLTRSIETEARPELPNAQ